MFGTWKYDPETDEVQNLRRAYDPVTARSSSHQACDRCHEKKLKCSGEKEGCERCISNSLRCEYTRSSSKSSRRGKKSHRKSEEESPKSSSSSTRAKGSGSSSSKKHSSHSSSSKHHKSHTHAPEAEPEGLLNSLDFSMLGPEDAFDLNCLSEQAGGGYGAGGSASQGYHQSVPTGSQHQWQHGYPASTSAATHSQYATAAYSYDQQGYADEGFAQYEDYQHDPRYYPHGHR